MSGLNFATLSINLNRYQNSDSQCYVDNVVKSYLLISEWMD